MGTQPSPLSTNGMALWSLITGLFSFCVPLLGILAIILGVLGIGNINKTGQGGRNLAIAGIVLGSLGVLFILMILPAIAIPSLLRSRMSANEACMIGSLKTIAAGQTDYNNNASPHTYTGSLACLGSGQGAGGVQFIDPQLATGVKSGYSFELVAGEPIESGMQEYGASIWTWSATAWPIDYRSTGVRSAYVDETGIVRAGDEGGGKATIDTPELY